jgi:hypothetical protein
MKTADKENPNRWDILVSNRAPGAGSQNRSCSIKWAAKQGNGQPLERCFLLTSTFIELTGHLKARLDIGVRTRVMVRISL